MMCPVCKRDLAPTLSICFTCGAMVNDSVREEMELKVGRVSDRLKRTSAVVAAAAAFKSEMVAEPIQAAEETTALPLPEPKPVRIPRGETTEFGNKKTSPTLVGFQPKTSAVPDWRLQLQNSIRQRKTDGEPSSPVVAIAGVGVPRAATPNAAPKAKPVEEPAVPHDNPRVAAALRRIETSRRRFMEEPVAKVKTEPPAAVRSYPFNVVAPRASEFAPRPSAMQATVNTLPKPRLVNAARIEKKKYDTNKLPPLPITISAAAAPARVVEPVIEEIEAPSVEPAVIAAPVAVAKPEPKMLPMIDDLANEFQGFDEGDDDLAALPSRFLAGLFDTIIGTFATGIILSPFLVSGGDWVTVSGAMTVMAAFGIVMFAYMTVAIGMRGRTVGMRLFGLEVVDAEENEYPSMHQAAVSSAVYLLSLPMLGLGFVPVLFNEERRAAHDLISGTVLVREI